MAISPVPGIYNEEIDSGPRPIDSISTGVIGIVGSASRGPVDEVRRVSSFAEFERIYGGIEAGYNLAENVNLAFNQGAQVVRPLRVTGSGANKAEAIFQDDLGGNTVKLTAKDYGEDGDQIEVRIAAGTTGGARSVSVIHNASGQTELYQNANMIASDDAYLVDRINAESQIVEAEDQGSTGLPAITTGTNLAGGLDGDSVGDGEVIGTTNPVSGLKLLETVDEINILMVAENSSSAVWAEMIAQCERTKDRICVLNCQSSLTPSQVISSVSSLESGRAIMPYPWVMIYDYWTKGTKYVSPAAAIAGVLSKIKAHESPSNQAVQGILGMKRALTEAEVEELHLARIVPITVKSGRGFRIRNGITLSSDPKWTQICKRRQLDKIEESVEDAMHWAISKPHTATLRDNVKTSVSNYLTTLVQAEEVGAGCTVKCDADNNPAASVQAGYLICDIGIEFLYPADRVVFRYSENLSEGFTATQLA